MPHQNLPKHISINKQFGCKRLLKTTHIHLKNTSCSNYAWHVIRIVG